MKTRVNIRAGMRIDETNGFSETLESRLDNLRDEVLAHPILRHPFLKLLAGGEIASEDIRLWISQQYYFSTQFPRCLAALFSRIGDYTASKLLIPFLNVEHWGSSSKEAHWRQFVKVLGFFDLDETGLRKAAPFPETSRYLNYRFRLCSSATVEEGLGCLGFAHELVNERIFAAFLSGVETVHGVTDDALIYFKAHVADEPGDYLLFREMTIKIAQTPRAISLVEHGARKTLNARSRFFDKILARIRLGGSVKPFQSNGKKTNPILARLVRNR